MNTCNGFMQNFLRVIINLWSSLNDSIQFVHLIIVVVAVLYLSISFITTTNNNINLINNAHHYFKKIIDTPIHRGDLFRTFITFITSNIICDYLLKKEKERYIYILFQPCLV